MSNSQTVVKLQVPMSRQLRDALEKYATDMGFDSAQAYIRFHVKSLADGRRVSFDKWDEPPAHVVKRWERELAEQRQQVADDNVIGYTDAEALVKDLLSDEAD